MQDNWWNLLDGTTPQMVADVALGVAVLGFITWVVAPAIALIIEAVA